MERLSKKIENGFIVKNFIFEAKKKKIRVYDLRTLELLEERTSVGIAFNPNFKLYRDVLMIYYGRSVFFYWLKEGKLSFLQLTIDPEEDHAHRMLKIGSKVHFVADGCNRQYKRAESTYFILR